MISKFHIAILLWVFPQSNHFLNPLTNQLTGFYMMETLVVKVLTVKWDPIDSIVLLPFSLA